MAKVALLYPPACDPTAPYLSVPTLAAYLRRAGVDVVAIDANAEAFDLLLRKAPLTELAQRVENRLARLEKKPALTHPEQLAYAALWAARADAAFAPGAIDDAVCVLRGGRARAAEAAPVDAGTNAAPRHAVDDARRAPIEAGTNAAPVEAGTNAAPVDAGTNAAQKNAADGARRAPIEAGTASRFYDAASYADAVGVVESALRLISAAYAPLSLSFTQYRTPFSLLDATEVRQDARPERNPFHAYYSGPLAARIAEEKPDVIGISIAFPGQIQPAYALAVVLRGLFPDVHITAGGPALTQLVQGLQGKALEAAIGPFDSLVAYEGEKALLALANDVAAGKKPRGLIHGEQTEDLGELPCPDFAGLPFDKYITPELVLPYDPTRGCYWGKCTFCHYGLAEVGTARYRERPVDDVIAHLEALHATYGTRVFYLSQDAVNPKTVLKVARAIVERHGAGPSGARDARNALPFRWSTDMRPERSLSPELCAELRAGGALSMALGVESAAPRVLSLIDKGVPVETVERAITNLATADIGVEAMCFTDFPTETFGEAMATVRFVEKNSAHLSLFICGEFDLTKGSLVAKKPADFGIAETWKVEGDELGCGLFWRHRDDPKSDDERGRVDEALAGASRRFRLARYPWAGALSTAHTLLYYARFGIHAFKHVAAAPAAHEANVRNARFDVAAVMDASSENEAAIWDELVNKRRAVSRAAWRALAEAVPAAKPAPGRWRFLVGAEPERVVEPSSRRFERGTVLPRGARPGRRVKHGAALSKEPVRGW